MEPLEVKIDLSAFMSNSRAENQSLDIKSSNEKKLLDKETPKQVTQVAQSQQSMQREEPRNPYRKTDNITVSRTEQRSKSQNDPRDYYVPPQRIEYVEDELEYAIPDSFQYVAVQTGHTKSQQMLQPLPSNMSKSYNPFGNFDYGHDEEADEGFDDQTFISEVTEKVRKLSTKMEGQISHKKLQVSSNSVFVLYNFHR